MVEFFEIKLFFDFVGVFFDVWMFLVDMKCYDFVDEVIDDD